MNNKLKSIASLVLVSAVSAAYAQSAPVHRHPHRKAAGSRSIEAQIEALRNQMTVQNSEIHQLQQQLNQRNQQLQEAQAAAQQAQTAAQQAQAVASQQLNSNVQAVSALQSSVAELKTSNQQAIHQVQAEQAKVTTMVAHPDVIHYKGVDLSLKGSYIEAATVYRNKATGGGIATAFTHIPMDGANDAHVSEFAATGRQSRLAFKFTGKAPNATLTAFYEMDWLGTGVTSNNNQSNSYVMRQRQLWAQAHLNDGWIFTGGQMWSLATETSNLLENGTEVLPGDIDPNYNAGFVWARQYGFRVVKDFNKNFAAGFSVENAQTLTPSCQAAGGTAACASNYLEGESGQGGGLYNSTTTYSHNVAPDLIAKIAYQNKYAHYEAFGIARFFRDRVYPDAASNSAEGAYNDTLTVGGIGGSARFHVVPTKLDVAIKGLYGEGVGRYGDSTIADTTVAPDGQLAPLHGFSALAEIVGHASPRFEYYADFGGDYAGRAYFASNGGYVGYGVPNINNTGCGTEVLPTGSYTPSNPKNCGGSTKDVQELSVGFNYYFYKGSYGALREGIQYSYMKRYLWSGIGGSPNGNLNELETSFRYYLP